MRNYWNIWRNKINMLDSNESFAISNFRIASAEYLIGILDMECLVSIIYPEMLVLSYINI